MPVLSGTLSPRRQEIYDRLAGQIGSTPLYELTNLAVPNGCRIFAKGEYRNPTGSHYDRETHALLLGKERLGEITPGPAGRPLLETTTGSSGASLAWMCRVLGYRCKIVIPEDMPGARIEQIRAYGAEVEPAPRGRYIGGLVGVIRDYLKTASRQYTFTNHSLDTTFGPAAMEELAIEALEQLASQELGAPNYFVCALGNGISANGVSRVLVERGTQIIGMEPAESPTVLREYFPDEFKARYPQGHADRRHQIYGTGPGQDASVVFPNVVEVGQRLSTVMLPEPQEWQSTQRNLLDLEAQHVGNSSAACVWAALKLAEEVPPGSTIFTIFYDAYWRYLPLQAAVDADERQMHPRDQLDAGRVAATALGLRP